MQGSIQFHLAYPISVGVLAFFGWPGSGLAGWASIITVSVGIATGFAILVEVIGRMVLLIPATIKKIRREERQKGRQEGRQEVQQAIREALTEGRDIQEILRSFDNEAGEGKT